MIRRRIMRVASLFRRHGFIAATPWRCPCRTPSNSLWSSFGGNRPRSSTRPRRGVSRRSDSRPFRRRLSGAAPIQTAGENAGQYCSYAPCPRALCSHISCSGSRTLNPESGVIRGKDSAGAGMVPPHCWPAIFKGQKARSTLLGFLPKFRAPLCFVRAIPVFRPLHENSTGICTPLQPFSVPKACVFITPGADCNRGLDPRVRQVVYASLNPPDGYPRFFFFAPVFWGGPPQPYPTEAFRHRRRCRNSPAPCRPIRNNDQTGVIRVTNPFRE